MKKKILLLASTLILLVGLALTTSAVGPRDCVTPQDWRTFGGFSRFDCPNGLAYPAFNVFRDYPNLFEGLAISGPEYQFAFVRVHNLANGQRHPSRDDANNGYRNEITLQPGEKAKVLNYIHNGGNPSLNRNGTTVAKNTRIKFEGFTQNAQGFYVTAPNSKHTLSVSISAENTTPRTIYDEYIINTPPNKILKLSVTDAATVEKCISTNGAFPPKCDDLVEEARIPTELVSPRGMLISSRTEGSGSSNDFLASEGYRVYVSAYITVEDAPASELCQNLTLIEQEIDENRKTGTFRVDLTPDNQANRNNLRARIVSGTGSVNINRGNNNSDNDIRINVGGWSNGTRLEVYIEGSNDRDCVKTYTFAESNQDICYQLNYTSQTNVAQRETRLNFTTSPNNLEFHQKFKVEKLEGNGTFTTNLNRLPLSTDVVISNWTDQSKFRFFVEGSPACVRELRLQVPQNICEDLTINSKVERNGVVTINFSVFPANTDLSGLTFSSNTPGLNVQRTGTTLTITNYTAETVLTITLGNNCKEIINFDDFVIGLCEKLELITDAYDHRSNPRPEFRFTTTPQSFAGPFTYNVVSRNGNIVESGNLSSKSFFPRNPLNGTQTVKVFATNFAAQCSDQAPGKFPPDICETIGVIRAVPTKQREGVYIPSNGEAIKLRLVDFREYEGDVIWSANSESVIFSDGNRSTRGRLTTNVNNPVIIRGGTPNTVVNVRAVDTSNNPNCSKQIFARDLPGDRPGRIIKTVDKQMVGSGEVVTYSVEYIIDLPEFFEGLFNSVTVWDDVLSIRGANAELNSRGRIELIPGSIRVSKSNGINLAGDILNESGLKIGSISRAGQSVKITYKAKVVSGLTPEACKTLTNDCGERFTNTARDSFGSSSKASVIAVCPFIVSRGFGDVFLEKEFRGGIDIAACSNRKSSEGPVFTPRAETGPNIASSGAGTQLVGATNRICKDSSKSNANNIEGYNNAIKGFSSSVCEVAIQNNEKWQKENIVKNLNANITRIARNNTNLNNASSLNSLTNDSLKTYDAGNPNPKNKVYRKTNGNLTLDSSTSEISISGGLKTIIVENGDLIINSNISYVDKDSVIAFLVVNGNIRISPDVTEIVGIYAAVNTNSTSNKGKIERTAQSNKEITIRGSVYGDIEPLFLGTTATGSLSRDRGAVSVIYDGRIVDKTPPGLSDIVKFNQYQSANQNTIYTGQ